MKPYPNSKGYGTVRLYKVPCVSSFLFVHRLVLEAFDRSPPSPRHQCNHKDTDKKHNYITNLEWVTPKENMQHAAAKGLLGRKDTCRGE